MLRLFNFLLLFIVSFSVHGQFQHLLHKSYAQRFVALDTLFYNNKVASYDSATFFNKVNQIASLARENDDQDLLLEAELLRLEYYMIGKKNNHQAFLQRMPEFIKKVDKEGIRHLQIRSRQKLAYYYTYIAQNYGPGLDNYLRSYELMKKMPNAELPDKQEMIAAIGRAYYKLDESEKAREFLAKAMNVPPSYRKRIAINNTNFFGLIYRQESKYDSALYYFRQAKQMAVANKDSVWIGIASGNIGITYYLQGKNEEAIPLLELDIKECLKAREVGNAVNSMIVLAKVHMKLGNPDKAAQITNRGLKLLNQTGDPAKYGAELYLLRANQFKDAANYKAAFVFLDSSRIYQNIVQERLNQALHQRAENKIELEQYHAEVEQEKQQEQLRNILVVCILGAVILIGIIVILMINRKRMLLKERQQQLQHEKETIATELDLAVQQLNEFTASIREKNRIIEQYESNENETAQLSKIEEEEEERNKVLNQLVNATILTDEQWDNFIQLFDKVHKGFMIRLREKLPHITPADTRYILLSKLNLSPREMASMLGVRPDAIRLYRHRLRKKLSLGEDESVQELIKNI